MNVPVPPEVMASQKKSSQWWGSPEQLQFEKAKQRSINWGEAVRQARESLPRQDDLKEFSMEYMRAFQFRADQIFDLLYNTAPWKRVKLEDIPGMKKGSDFLPQKRETDDDIAMAKHWIDVEAAKCREYKDWEQANNKLQAQPWCNGEYVTYFKSKYDIWTQTQKNAR